MTRTKSLDRLMKQLVIMGEELVTIEVTTLDYIDAGVLPGDIMSWHGDTQELHHWYHPGCQIEDLGKKL